VKPLARRNILKIKTYQPGKPIEELERELKIKGAVKLASNENPLGPSPKAVAAIKRHLTQINRYPIGDCFYLRMALAAKLRVKPKELIFGNGSDELIVLATKAFIEKGDEVIIARPTFLIYEIASLIAGARIKFAPLKNFRYDLPAMKKMIGPKTKIVFLANPDNPTGSYVTKAELKQFLQGLPKNLLIFLDEAYFELVEEKDYPNGLRYFRSRNLIVGRTFSKAYGLSGLRIGYALAKPYLIECMEKVREPFNVNRLAQVAAEAALKDKSFLARYRRLLRREKRYLYQEFEKLGLPYLKSATNFIVFKLKKDARPLYERLLRKGVIVREMSGWKLKNFIRVTIGKAKENRKFIQALKEIIKKQEA
jgi:histidinol-phosphate aminotransferase